MNTTPRILTQSRLAAPSQTRLLSSSSSSSPSPSPSLSQLTTLLSKPTWSVRSLLPSPSPSSPSPSSPSQPKITPQTLHHLLRLSALPLPSSTAAANNKNNEEEEEEASLLATLDSQLGFVRAVRGVDTRGVEPLRAIRDETRAGLERQTVGVAALRGALGREVVVGHARRPRRRRRRGEEKGAQEEDEENNWDVLGGASETAAARYFVVRAGSDGGGDAGSGSSAGSSKNGDSHLI
ncbi:hypothetical protein F5X99DRAFT_24744 [Biscogniauxia marginata]|nr:hypothetical protein F5X99DRAFT_24744 [Biscogniauxia marginata]